MENLSLASSEDYSQKKSISINKELINSVSFTPIFLNNFAYKSIGIHPAQSKNINFFLKECFYLIYSIEGTIRTSVNYTNYRISSMESFLSYDKTGEGISLQNLSKKNTKCFIIAYHPGDTLNDSTMNRYLKFKKMFSELVQKNSFTGRRNLETYEKINLLSQLTHKKITDDFIIEGILFQIFGIEINQIIEDTTPSMNSFSQFSFKEIEQLQIISNEIEEEPQKKYSIDFLCRKTGIGPNKLQKGFKRMHDQTVINYIRHMRLKRAVELMKTTDLTISEIVYSIGLSSRSYFSKIFKTHYNCLPKDFQKRQKS